MLYNHGNIRHRDRVGLLSTLPFDLPLVLIPLPAHLATFDEAQHRSGNRDMVLIDDQLETDVPGTNHYGIASVLVSGGAAGSYHNHAFDVPRPHFILRDRPA